MGLEEDIGKASKVNMIKKKKKETRICRESRTISSVVESR